ncbi:MAG: hypothetical protein IPO68_00020 [Chitinophagaceae bacterium]|nr:hypothetical protein [Chitinophagaceae bacterium]
MTLLSVLLVNATFNYNAQLITAKIIQVTLLIIYYTGNSFCPFNKATIVDNITYQSINNSLGNTAIPSLSATDLDGTVASYTIGQYSTPVERGCVESLMPIYTQQVQLVQVALQL